MTETKPCQSLPADQPAQDRHRHAFNEWLGVSALMVDTVGPHAKEKKGADEECRADVDERHGGHYRPKIELSALLSNIARAIKQHEGENEEGNKHRDGQAVKWSHFGSVSSRLRCMSLKRTRMTDQAFAISVEQTQRVHAALNAISRHLKELHKKGGPDN